MKLLDKFTRGFSKEALLEELNVSKRRELEQKQCLITKQNHEASKS